MAENEAHARKPAPAESAAAGPNPAEQETGQTVGVGRRGPLLAGWSPADLIGLQRSLGNRAVQRLFHGAGSPLIQRALPTDKPGWAAALQGKQTADPHEWVTLLTAMDKAHTFAVDDPLVVINGVIRLHPLKLAELAESTELSLNKVIVASLNESGTPGSLQNTNEVLKTDGLRLRLDRQLVAEVDNFIVAIIESGSQDRIKELLEDDPDQSRARLFDLANDNLKDTQRKAAAIYALKQNPATIREFANHYTFHAAHTEKEAKDDDAVRVAYNERDRGLMVANPNQPGLADRTAGDVIAQIKATRDSISFENVPALISHMEKHPIQNKAADPVASYLRWARFIIARGGGAATRNQFDKGWSVSFDYDGNSTLVRVTPDGTPFIATHMPNMDKPAVGDTPKVRPFLSLLQAKEKFQSGRKKIQEDLNGSNIFIGWGTKSGTGFLEFTPPVAKAPSVPPPMPVAIVVAGYGPADAFSVEKQTSGPKSSVAIKLTLKENEYITGQHIIDKVTELVRQAVSDALAQHSLSAASAASAPAVAPPDSNAAENLYYELAQEISDAQTINRHVSVSQLATAFAAHFQRANLVPGSSAFRAEADKLARFVKHEAAAYSAEVARLEETLRDLEAVAKALRMEAARDKFIKRLAAIEEAWAARMLDNDKPDASKDYTSEVRKLNEEARNTFDDLKLATEKQGQEYLASLGSTTQRDEQTGRTDNALVLLAHFEDKVAKVELACIKDLPTIKDGGRNLKIALGKAQKDANKLKEEIDKQYGEAMGLEIPKIKEGLTKKITPLLELLKTIQAIQIHETYLSDPQGFDQVKKGTASPPAASAVTPALIRHLIVPEANRLANFKTSGISGGHHDSALWEFMQSHPEYHLVLRRTKTAGGMMLSLYNQYMWKDPDIPPPELDNAGARPSASDEKAADWEKAPVLKSTCDDLIAYLREGELAWLAWENFDPDGPASQRLGREMYKGVKDEANKASAPDSGIEYGGRLEKDKNEEWHLSTIVPHVEWFFS